MDLFGNMASPKMKISDLVSKGELIPIKRGIYLHGKVYKRHYSKLVLAGMIYGPSAISFEYALSYHGLIPERVELIQSICFKRDKIFETPIGNFKYKYISEKLYSLGISYHQTELGNFFMATPEKAICDMAYFEKFVHFSEVEKYLFDSLRIDKSELAKMDLELLNELESTYKRKSVQMIVRAIKEQV